VGKLAGLGLRAGYSLEEGAADYVRGYLASALGHLNSVMPG